MALSLGATVRVVSPGVHLVFTFWSPGGYHWPGLGRAPGGCSPQGPRRSTRDTEAVLDVGLIVAALGFAFVSGANDGATLGATGARAASVSILVALAVLAVAVGVVPVLVGTGVATTLAHGLVSFDHRGGRLAFLAAVVAGLAVVAVLSRRGLPTSVTLALTGGILGAGIGADLPLHWETMIVVVVAGVVGPLLAAVVGYALASRVRSTLGPGSQRPGRSRVLRRSGFVLQSFAYGSNGAEKLVAFAAVATGASVDPVRPELGTQFAVAACFVAGAVVAVGRLSNRVTDQMVRARPEGALSALVASSVLVLAGAAVGLPVSSTQASTASLIGATARLTPNRVRLGQVVSLAIAWSLTLPVAVAGGVVLGLAVRITR